MIDTKDSSTKGVITLARKAAEERGIDTVVIATTKGECGQTALEVFQGSGIQVIAVTHSTGFREPGNQELPEDVRQKLESGGIRVLTGTMPFHGIEDCLRKNRSSYTPVNAMADALRLLGQGTKVCVEIACMAADAGLVKEGEDIIAVAGTHFGADTIELVRAASTRRILDTKVREVIAKPSDW